MKLVRACVFLRFVLWSNPSVGWLEFKASSTCLRELQGHRPRQRQRSITLAAGPEDLPERNLACMSTRRAGATVAFSKADGRWVVRGQLLGLLTGGSGGTQQGGGGALAPDL